MSTITTKGQASLSNPGINPTSSLVRGVDVLILRRPGSPLRAGMGR